MKKIKIKIVKHLLTILLGLIALPCFNTLTVLAQTDAYTQEIQVGQKAESTNLNNRNLQARITLDPKFKPAHSPGVNIENETLDKEGAETALANYLLQILAGGLITVAAPVAIIVIAIAGLIATVSHGDQKLIDRAKKTLLWAVIGLGIIIFAWVIVRSAIELVLSFNNSSKETTEQELDKWSAEQASTADQPRYP